MLLTIDPLTRLAACRFALAAHDLQHGKRVWQSARVRKDRDALFEDVMAAAKAVDAEREVRLESEVAA